MIRVRLKGHVAPLRVAAHWRKRSKATAPSRPRRRSGTVRGDVHAVGAPAVRVLDLSVAIWSTENGSALFQGYRGRGRLIVISDTFSTAASAQNA